MLGFNYFKSEINVNMEFDGNINYHCIIIANINDDANLTLVLSSSADSLWCLRCPQAYGA